MFKTLAISPCSVFQMSHYMLWGLRNNFSNEVKNESMYRNVYLYIVGKINTLMLYF